MAYTKSFKAQITWKQETFNFFIHICSFIFCLEGAGSSYGAQNDFEYDPFASASWVPGLQVYATKFFPIEQKKT